MIQKDNCFLVEGYTDVISLHQKGIENVVASSGTSLTSGQIKLIKRFTPNITVLYDGDDAGIKASFRGIDLILKEGMNVKVITFPEGEDPDSFARANNSVGVEDYINHNQKDFISFKTSVLLKDAQNDPIKRANLIKEVVQTIAIIPDVIIRSVYTQDREGERAKWGNYVRLSPNTCCLKDDERRTCRSKRNRGKEEE